MKITKRDIRRLNESLKKWIRLTENDDSFSLYKQDSEDLINSLGVEHNDYELTFSDGKKYIMDVADPEDWKCIEKLGSFVGCDGDKIVKVEDLHSGETWVGRSINEWAKERVWCYNDVYTSFK